VRNEQWKHAIEITGMAAIVASLVFVGIQLQQDRVIARSELTSDSFQIISSIQDRLTDPDLAATFSKMLHDPEELSFEEKVQIDNLFKRVVGAYTRECYLKGRGILGECDAIIRATARDYFGNSYGQAWYRLNGPKGRENDEMFPFPNWVEAEIQGFDSDLYRQSIIDTKAME
jgi:hypothetical protein